MGRTWQDALHAILSYSAILLHAMFPQESNEKYQLLDRQCQGLESDLQALDHTSSASDGATEPLSPPRSTYPYLSPQDALDKNEQLTRQLAAVEEDIEAPIVHDCI